MSAITLRALEAADAEQVQAVALEAWRWTYGDIFDAAFIAEFVGRNYAPEQLRQTLPVIERGDGYFTVALDSGDVVGFCQIGVAPDGAAHLFRLYLRPAYIRQGVGSRLLDGGESWLAAKGIREYSCYVHSANVVGRRFYERRGFEHLPERDQDAEWFMRRRLAAGKG